MPPAMREALKELGWLRAVAIAAIYAASFYVLCLQLIWYYFQPLLLPNYYVVHAIAFASVLWRFRFSSGAYRYWILFAAAVLMGMIPFELRVHFLERWVTAGEIDTETLSDLTKHLAMPIRIFIEISFLPAIHWVVLSFIPLVLRRTR